jgi:hypothetical protein
MNLSEKIIQVASSYVGQEEISGNKGFKNPLFQKKIQACGWKMGHSWCAYFTELVWKEAFGKSHPLYNTLDRLFSPSAIGTYSNMKGAIGDKNIPTFKTGIKPKVGALAVWRLGNGWQGHIGIVESVIDNKKFGTIEGNTNSSGSREGIEVARKIRSLGEIYKLKGLNLIGFVYPE